VSLVDGVHAEASTQRYLPRHHEWLLRNVFNPVLRAGGHRFGPFWWIYDRAYRRLGRGVTTIGIPEGRLWLDLRDQVIAKQLWAWGWWEKLETSLFRAALQQGDVVVDAGANVGYYSLIAARGVGSRGAVHAFEPAHHVRELLMRMAHTNRLENLEIHSAALSDREEDIRVYLSQDNFGDHRTVPAGEDRWYVGGHATELDKTLPIGNGGISVLKIDTQGAEASIVRGAKRTIAKSPDVTLFMEFWPEALRRAGEDRPVELLWFLWGLGFRGFHLVDERVGRARPAEISEIPDYCEGRDNVSILASKGKVPAKLAAALGS
jgi:FkbM family methyltransferase